MNFIKNLKIREKLLMLLFILFIPLLFFIIDKVSKEMEENKILKEISVKLTESEMLSRYVHEFQRERARILAAHGKDSNLFISEALEQRQITDLAEKNLKEFEESHHRTFTDIALINDFDKYRKDFDQGNINTAEFYNYSNNLIYSFLDRIRQNAQGISNVKIRRRLISFVNLVSTKVELARMRSLLMRVFQGKGFSYQDYGTFVSNWDSYRKSLKEFNEYSSEESILDLQTILTKSKYNEVLATIQKINQDPHFTVSSDQSVQVFDQFTTSINGIRECESHLIKAIRSELDEESTNREMNLVFLISVLIITLVLVSFLSIYIINLISNSLSTLKIAADKVAIGATDVTINIDGKDEIGKLAESFQKVVNKNISLSKVAEEIGQGKYDVNIEVNSKEDILSNAIQDMKNNLAKFTRENNHRNWIINGVSELNNLSSGVNELDALTNKIISFLCAYTQSEVGIIYLMDESGNLIPSASFGLKCSLQEIKSFKLGTGVIGQAAYEMKIKVLNEVPHEYMKIETGISDITPATLLILPLSFSNHVVGVIELGTRNNYTELQQEFLKIVSERIAIISQTLQSHLKTQELLYETQNQAEELETQQEELRQMNTELKASEEELRVSQEELQEKNIELEEKAQLLEEQYETVNVKNKALEDVRQAIELKIQQVETVSKYKSEFLANMSHELRTPLNSILILSKLLADNKEKNLNAKQSEHAQIIHNSGADLLKIINEILDLSKVESGQVKLEISEVNLREIKLEEGFKELAKNKNIHLDIQFADNIGTTIKTDKFRLEQILKNLLSNAFKFTDKGGNVSVSVYRPSGVTFRSENLRQSKGVIAFSVKDNGIGIPKDKQASIFEAFQQADSSTTRKYGGTGLGLAISKELAALLGGEINVESEPGKGSTFTLFLPMEYKGEVKSLPAIQPDILPKSQTKGSPLDKFLHFDETKKRQICILIIEDDKGFNNILADFSLAKHFKVYQAFTGRDGLKIAREVYPDAILLDINLPDISGWDVLKEIRADKELKNINVHVMSAYDKEIVDKYHENAEYLPKPVTLEMLDKAFVDISSITDKSIETILIVEDNKVENNAIGELLLSHSIESVSAFSAEEAEKILAKRKIDCIILDLNLPGMKGNEWMEKIRSGKELADIPIIVYSGKDLSEEEEIKLKKYANTIIIKNEYSYLRLLDEVQLFLHKVNQKLPIGSEYKMKLHVPQEILKGKKVLIVDDDVRNVYSLLSLLEMQEMNVVAANDGKEALAKIEIEKGIDIILMDIMMPEMDGIEATKRIRKNPAYKNVPIIALTAKAMKGDREKCIDAGASDYIPKPIDTDKLLTLMRVWLYES